MAKELKTSVSVVITDTDINQTTRFMDKAVSHEPVSYEHGEANLAPGLADHQLAAGANMIQIYSDSPFSIKIGNTTETAHLNMKMFSYDGEPKDFFVSNPGTDPITLAFVMGKFYSSAPLGGH
jgi:hypothetical protein